MILIWIVLILIIVIIIERIIVCSKRNIKIDPQKINKLNINGKICYLISGDVFNLTQKNENVEIEKNGEKMFLKGTIFTVPVHVSEKLKNVSFSKSIPINSICSLWDCYTTVATGNIIGNFKLISEDRIDNICICNNSLYFS